MLAIKLKLVGKKRQHSFRVIIQEKRAKLQGKFTDDIGWYNPHTNQFKVNQERLKYWLENGAQPTETVQKILKNAQDSSEVQDYAGRQRPKKKKKEKIAEQGGQEGADAPAESEAPEKEAEGDGNTPEPEKEEPKEEKQEEPTPEEEKKPEGE